MKKYILHFVVWYAVFNLVLFTTSAQKNWQPNDYFGIPENIKQPIFFDDFESNQNLWDLGEEKNTWTEKIENGQLNIESLDYLSIQDYIPIPFNPDIDFEIEASINIASGDPGQACGLQWGKAAEGDKQFDFFVSASGQYTIDKFEDGFNDYVPFTASPLVNKDGHNKLTVRKVDGEYYFFINEKLVHNMPFVPFLGKNIGFQAGKKTQIQVDYLKVSELINIDKILPSELMIMDYAFQCKGNIKKREVPITLTLTMKNTGETAVKNATVKIVIPFNVEFKGTDELLIDEISPGKEQKLFYSFYAKKEYNKDIIKFNVEINGANYTNANNLDISLSLNEQLPNGKQEKPVEYAEYRGSGDPLKGLNVAKARAEIQIGNYYALIIGIDNYQGDWKKLANAVNDAKSVETTLKENYQFDYFKTLYNEQATRKNVITEMEWLTENVTTNDNVFIFYSGHGDYKPDIQKGYWVPVDATSTSVTNYISNADIQALLAGIKSKHTLLITDACFSGDIFRGKTLTLPYEDNDKYYNKVYSLTSRKAISSGGLEPVMDGGKEGHSVFTYYLLKSLQSNHNRFYDAGQLYNDLKIPVVNNSEQTPEFNPIRNTGDEGGQFIFIRKD